MVESYCDDKLIDDKQFKDWKRKVEEKTAMVMTAIGNSYEDDLITMLAASASMGMLAGMEITKKMSEGDITFDSFEEIAMLYGIIRNIISTIGKTYKEAETWLAENGND